MGIEEKPSTTIENSSDEEIFEETAKRLRKQYRVEHGLDFLYGCFEFIFHDGAFQGIEDRPRYKRYRSNNKLNRKVY